MDTLSALPDPFWDDRVHRFPITKEPVTRALVLSLVLA